MPSDASEQHLHPSSILFSIGKSAKIFLLPGLVLLFSAGRQSGPRFFGGNWDFWFMLLMIPSTIAAVAKYLSFRLRYEGTELVIRSGILFRNERKIPYSRIQNLDAVQNPVHRALGVVEVRVETGGGNEAEATISVLPLDAFSEMRRRVFEGRAESRPALDPSVAPGAVAALSEESAASHSATLLELPLKELLLFGFLENRGAVLIGAFLGVLWEVGLLDALGDSVFGENSYGRGFFRDIGRTLASGNHVSLRQVGVALGFLLTLLLFIRLTSLAWAVIRLYGFRLTRAGDDLRCAFGLITRVASTIPRRRIQTVTILEGPLHRVVGRASVRVETAGGGGAKGANGQPTKEREWLAPLVTLAGLPELLRQVDPTLDLAALPWQPADPRAFRRALKPRMLRSLLIALPLAWLFRWWSIPLVLFVIAAAAVEARKFVAHLGWATTDDVIAFRRGWLWRSITIARAAKIQAVTQLETPFDRRAGMAQVRVDTAGAGERSRRVHIPYLPRDTARALQQRLAAQAANTAFRW
jgi:putative membrane protein